MERFSQEIRNQIKAHVKNDDVENNVMVGFSDIDGQIPRGRVIEMNDERIQNLPMSGPSFTGGSVRGAGQGPEHPEMVAHIDPDTYVPPKEWMPLCSFYLSSLFVNGKPHPYCPRGNLQRVLAEVRQKHGLVFLLGVEPEHYIIAPDKNGTMQPWNPKGMDCAKMTGYSLGAIFDMLPYLLEMKRYMKEMGWEPYQVDHEDGSAQCELNWKYSDAVKTCDRLVYFRTMARQVVHQTLGNDVRVTFKPKPFDGLCGSGLHMHFSAINCESDDNPFSDPRDPKGLGLSEWGYQFLAGIIEHSDALCALGNPTHQCYKRLHPPKNSDGKHTDSGNHWVPVKKLIGGDNRTGMLRVPEPGHIEDRSPSAACNPYLFFAAYVQAGLDGVARNLQAPEPLVGSAFQEKYQEVAELPKTLAQALKALEVNTVVKEALGPIADEFLKLKWLEKEQYDDRDQFSYF